MKRREMLLSAGAAVCGLSAFPLAWVPAAEKRKQRLLYFTRCAGFVHPVVDRKGKSELSFSEQVLTKMCGDVGVEVVCTKDGNVFDRQKKPGQTLDLDQFDAVAFYTSGYLTQGGDDPTTSRARPRPRVRGSAGWLGADLSDAELGRRHDLYRLRYERWILHQPALR